MATGRTGFAVFGVGFLCAGAEIMLVAPPQKGLTVFMYHHVAITAPTDGQYPFTVTPQQFESHLEVLKKLGKTPIGLTDLKSTAVKNPVMLTFDDGHQDNYTTLFPLLKSTTSRPSSF